MLASQVQRHPNASQNSHFQDQSVCNEPSHEDIQVLNALLGKDMEAAKDFDLNSLIFPPQDSLQTKVAYLSLSVDTLKNQYEVLYNYLLEQSGAEGRSEVIQENIKRQLEEHDKKIISSQQESSSRKKKDEQLIQALEKSEIQRKEFEKSINEITEQVNNIEIKLQEYIEKAKPSSAPTPIYSSFKKVFQKAYDFPLTKQLFMATYSLSGYLLSEKAKKNISILSTPLQLSSTAFKTVLIASMLLIFTKGICQCLKSYDYAEPYLNFALDYYSQLSLPYKILICSLTAFSISSFCVKFFERKKSIGILQN